MWVQFSNLVELLVYKLPKDLITEVCLPLGSFLNLNGKFFEKRFSCISKIRERKSVSPAKQQKLIMASL